MPPLSLTIGRGNVLPAIPRPPTVKLGALCIPMDAELLTLPTHDRAKLSTCLTFTALYPVAHMFGFMETLWQKLETGHSLVQPGLSFSTRAIWY